MSFDQDPNETARISGSDFAQMCDEMKQLRAERDALRADSRELKALLLLLANAVHDENWKEIGSLVPRMAAVFATPAQ